MVCLLLIGIAGLYTGRGDGRENYSRLEKQNRTLFKLIYVIICMLLMPGCACRWGVSPHTRLQLKRKRVEDPTVGTQLPTLQRWK